MTAESRIRDRAVELGFDRFGIAPARPAPRAQEFHQWLEQGFHGEMAWLARDPHRRADPREVLPGARSVIVVGFSYFVEDPDPNLWNDPLRGRIARYAWGPDYHDELTPCLRELAEFVRAETGGEARYYVDTGPVLERSIAADAGLGFIGKNSLLIDSASGSYLFLAVILTTAELEGSANARAEETGTCGSCRRCLDICPTLAFPAAYVLDSRKCISYLTIELKGEIPEPLRPRMKNWIYGCDECQSVCPWVRQYAEPREHPFLGFDPDFCAPVLTELLALDPDAFRERFRGTPMKRTKRRGILRNAAVALGNAGDASAKPALENALQDPEPLVQAHARWALDRL